METFNQENPGKTAKLARKTRKTFFKMSDNWRVWCARL